MRGELHDTNRKGFWFGNYRPGENISLNILRENQEIEISMKLEKY